MSSCSISLIVIFLLLLTLQSVYNNNNIKINKYENHIRSSFDKLPVLNMTGFAWAENQEFTFNGLYQFVSDSTTGIIWRISLNSATDSYEREQWLTGFKRCLGLVSNLESTTIYAVIQTSKENGKLNQIISFSPTTKDQFSIVATLPNSFGNGLGMYYKTGKLYCATEGNFFPFKGEVYEIDPNSGEVTTIIKRLNGADGVQIDQNSSLLYISEVVAKKMIVYDLNTGEHTKYNVPMKSIDDFTFSKDYSKIIAADYFNGTIVSFMADGSNSLPPEILYTGLTNPTSVLFGIPPSFSSNNLYITEGGGKTKSVNNRSDMELIIN